MKKKFILLMLIVVAFFAGFNVFQSQEAVAASDLVLNNVEALARGEIENYYDFHLVTEGSYKVCRRSGGVCNVHDQMPC